MNKNSMEKIVKVIEKENKGEAVIFTTEAGTYINGNAVDLVTQFTMIARSLNKNGLSKEILDTAYELSFKHGEELLDEIMNRLEKTMAELKSGLKGEKE